MISIAIVTLNNAEYLNLAIQGLIRNSSEEFEVLVHVNEYRKQSAISTIIERWQNAGILSHVTTSEDNQFCAAPLNKLFNDHASGDFFIFLDDDIYPAWGWDHALLSAIPDHTKYWWMSPTLYYPKCSHQRTRYNTQSFGLTPAQFNVDAFNKNYLTCRNITEDNEGWISGAGLISREVWDAIGGYDEQFLLGEDVDIKAKIWDAARKANVPYDFRSIANSIIYHFGHSGSSKRPVAVDPFVLFQRKWGISITEFYKKALPKIDYL